MANASNFGRPCVLRSIVLCALILGQGAALAQVAAGGKIGYVDMKRLIDNAPQLDAARALLEAEFAERDAALKTEQARLTELTARQRQPSAQAPADEATALDREIELLSRNIERTRARLREDLNRRAQEEYTRRWDSMHDEVVAFARENGYDLIVESPVVYASPSVDITDAILERLRGPRPAAGTP